MSHVCLIASSSPLPLKVTLNDLGINNGESFEYGPTVETSKYFRITPIEVGYIKDESGYEYDVIADLPKILPKHIYFFDGIISFHDHQPATFREESRAELKKFRLYIKHLIESMNEICMVFQSVPNGVACSENIRPVEVCIDDLDLDSSSFSLSLSKLCRFVNHKVPSFTDYGDAGLNNNYCCVTMLACPNKLSEGYAKEYGLMVPDVSTPYFNQHELHLNKKDMGLEEFYTIYLAAVSDLPNILPPNIYISGLDPSFHPWGNECDRNNRKNIVKRILNYLQSIVDEQGEVWYIRQWLPDKITNASSVKIRTLNVDELDINNEEFEFELCVLYNFVK